MSRSRDNSPNSVPRSSGSTARLRSATQGVSRGRPRRPESIGQAAAAIGDQVDSLFNVAGVSSGIGDPLLVVTINFLGMRQFHRGAGRDDASRVVDRQRVLAGRGRLPRAQARHAGLLNTRTIDEGIDWCRRHPDALADGGYRLSKEAVILYSMRNAAPCGARGIRINCTGPGVTETPILDQLRSAYGQQFLDDIPKPLGRVAEPAEQAAVLVFLNSQAASYISGQVIWVDGGNVRRPPSPAPACREAEQWPA